MTFAPMPLRIETERLVLTPEEAGDVDWLTDLFNDRGTQRFTVEDARERIVAMQAMTAELGIGVLVLRLRKTEEPLGYCGIVLGRGSLDEPELADELLPAARGRGYATEAPARFSRRSSRPGGRGSGQPWPPGTPHHSPSWPSSASAATTSAASPEGTSCGCCATVEGARDDGRTGPATRHPPEALSRLGHETAARGHQPARAVTASGSRSWNRRISVPSGR
jgi:hypothetical protein